MLTFEKFVAFRYLRSPRQEGFISVIAWFSFLGIALGVATLIIVMSVMNGFRTELLKTMVGMRGHILINGTYKNIEGDNTAIGTVKAHPMVESAFPMLERQAVLNMRSQARGVIIHGIDPIDLASRTSIRDGMHAGDLNNFKDEHILIGKRLSELMHITVGDKIMLLSPEGNNTAFGTLPRQKAFTVAGIFEIGMNEFDKNIIFMPLSAAQSFFKEHNHITHIEVFAKKPELTNQIVKDLQQKLGAQVNVLDWQHSNAGIFHAVQVERNVMFLILTLIILIASFNIISSLIMLVKDKTRDIAIMRTMGASRQSMMSIFMITGASIGTIGTLLGVALGLSFALNIESIRQWLQGFTGTDLFSAEIYFLTRLPAQVDFGEVTLVAAMALGLSFLATIYPAWRAARLDPVEALRF
jgi:lipoprotein-releasing system permease protein